MMKPEVRVIEPQREESTPTHISDWEKNQLLMKYGYQHPIDEIQIQREFDVTRDLSYQEMMELEDRRYRQELENKNREINRPNSYTIDNRNIKYSDSRWSSLEVGGSDIGFQVQIVSDMNINR